jgi:hypothetical protein
VPLEECTYALTIYLVKANNFHSMNMFSHFCDKILECIFLEHGLKVIIIYDSLCMLHKILRNSISEALLGI